MQDEYNIISLRIAVSRIRRTPTKTRNRHTYGEIVYALYPDTEEKDYGRMRAAIYHIAKKGYRPRGAKLRGLLGLCGYEKLEVCPIHGVVHTVACPDMKAKPCPSDRKRRLAARPDFRLRPVQVLCTGEQYKIILETPTSERAKRFLNE